MAIKPALVLYLLRSTVWVTVPAVTISCLYVLLSVHVLGWRSGGPAVFILVHSLALTQLTGRFRTGAFAFLYTRGYSRDQLWAHTMLATLVSVAAAWLPAALIIWTGARSGFQGYVFRNPNFPVMAPLESPLPWAWLLGYAVCIPSLHYDWIRSAQPTRGGVRGPFLAVGALLAGWTLITIGGRNEWFGWVALSAGLVVAAATVIGGRALHRRLEVRA